MAQISTINLTENEFINKEISVWGFSYVENLLDRGFEPKLTDKGWTWILPVKSNSYV